jgi:hypothetical protein
MLTGRQLFPVPYDKQTNAPLLTELYKMQRAGVQLKPVELCSDLPEAAQAALLRALEFDPQARHAEARDFGDELAEALTGEWLRASPSAPTEIITPGIDERTCNWPGATSGLTCRYSSNGLISPSRPSTGSEVNSRSKR